MPVTINDKLKILAGAAKYDVSCASSGNRRTNNGRGFGNTAYGGICHSFTEDGRCISLLKVMLTNHCVNDCAYCVSKSSNDIPRATFAVNELVTLTSELYRRNYIEGLFLSSGILKTADYTMERMVSVAKELRINHRFYGYIHLKAIPGTSQDLIHQAGLYADRLSVNMEIASEPNLKMLAPQKDYNSILSPMYIIRDEIVRNKDERRRFRSTPHFSPAGQSTQLIIGATDDTDYQILNLATGLYRTQNLKRVYYSGYLPVNTNDNRLPAIAAPPLKRENRLYQADWLFRFYFFSVDEILNASHPNLDLDIDPKLGYALRNPQLFPVDINTASYELLLRVPGIGPKSAQMIVQARKYNKLGTDNLKKIGVVLKRAQYFITYKELRVPTIHELKPEVVKRQILQAEMHPARVQKVQSTQLKLFSD
jgi:putative DNA modification/repair radical SAM protein